MFRKSLSRPGASISTMRLGAARRALVSASPWAAMYRTRNFGASYATLRATPVPAKARSRALIAEYKKSNDWDNLRPVSRRGYSHFLNQLEAEGGDRPVAAMTRRDIYALLDRMSTQPFTANYMLAVLRTLLEFGVPRGYRDDNPAIGVKRLKVADNGHSPWPDDRVRFCHGARTDSSAAHGVPWTLDRPEDFRPGQDAPR